MPDKKCLLRIWFGRGYANKGLEVPFTVVGKLVVVEAVNMLFPVFELEMNDPWAVYTDEMGLGNVTISIQLSKDSPAFLFDGSVTSMPEESPRFVRETYMVPLRLRGIAYIAHGLVQIAHRRSFPNSTSQDVFKRIAREAASTTRSSIHSWLLEPTRDRETYLQPGWSNSRMLLYLAEKASTMDGLGGFMPWFDVERTKGGSAKYRAAFVTMQYLARQSVKHRILVSQNPELVEEAEKNEGRLKTGEWLALGFSYQYQTSFNVQDYDVTVSAVDVEGECVRERRFDCDELNLTVLGLRRSREFYDPFYGFRNKKGFRYIGPADRNEMRREYASQVARRMYKRNMSVLIYGNEDIRLGDKVNVVVPLSKEKPHFLSLAGDWVVTKISHVVTMPSAKYRQKLVLTRDEFLGNVGG